MTSVKTDCEIIRFPNIQNPIGTMTNRVDAGATRQGRKLTGNFNCLIKV